jgi:hypothetical protein
VTNRFICILNLTNFLFVWRELCVPFPHNIQRSFVYSLAKKF